MSAPKNLDDYIDVAERILAFYKTYPDGRLVTKESGPAPTSDLSDGKAFDVVKLGDQTFLLFRALAYRTPDDPLPAEGIAWEPFPGKTPFTADSEVQNGQTSSIGRAIAMCGIEVRRGIATAQDVQNRSGDNEESGSERGGQPAGRATAGSQSFHGPASQDQRISEGKARRAFAKKKAHNWNDADWKLLLAHFKVSDPEELHFRAYDEFIEFVDRVHPLPDPKTNDIPADQLVEQVKDELDGEEIPF